MTDPAILSIIIRYLSLVINSITLIIGTVGGLCNLITFTSPKLRRSSCVFYLLCATAFQLISILVIVPTRIALDYFDDGLERQSMVFCKLRYYLIVTLPELGTFYILLAILDRCLATSNHARMRQWSQLKVAHRLAAITLIFGFVSNVHILVFQTIYNGNCQVPPRSFYALFITLYYLLVVILLPLTSMLILSIVTVWHVRQAKRRVRPAVTAIQTRLPSHRFEVRIITIIIAHVIVMSLFSTLRMGSYLYTTLTSSNLHKTVDEQVAESFALQLGVALYYLSFAVSFYVSTLTSKSFRSIFWKRVKTFSRHCWMRS